MNRNPIRIPAWADLGLVILASAAILIKRAFLGAPGNIHEWFFFVETARLEAGQIPMADFFSYGYLWPWFNTWGMLLCGGGLKGLVLFQLGFLPVLILGAAALSGRLLGLSIWGRLCVLAAFLMAGVDFPQHVRSVLATLLVSVWIRAGGDVAGRRLFWVWPGVLLLLCFSGDMGCFAAASAAILTLTLFLTARQGTAALWAGGITTLLVATALYQWTPWLPATWIRMAQAASQYPWAFGHPPPSPFEPGWATLTLLLTLVPAGACVGIWRFRQGDPGRGLQILVLAALLGSSLRVAFGRSDGAHIVYVLPAALLLFAVLAETFRTRIRTVLTLALLAAGVMSGFDVGRLGEYAHRLGSNRFQAGVAGREPGVPGATFEHRGVHFTGLPAEGLSVALPFLASHPGESVFVPFTSLPAALGDDPTRLDSDWWSAMLAGPASLATHLEVIHREAAPHAIFVRFGVDGYYPVQSIDPVLDYLDRWYAPVDRQPGCVIYRRRDHPQEPLELLSRRALSRSVMPDEPWTLEIPPGAEILEIRYEVTYTPGFASCALLAWEATDERGPLAEDSGMRARLETTPGPHCYRLYLRGGGRVTLVARASGLLGLRPRDFRATAATWSRFAFPPSVRRLNEPWDLRRDRDD